MGGGGGSDRNCFRARIAWNRLNVILKDVESDIGLRIGSQSAKMEASIS